MTDTDYAVQRLTETHYVFEAGRMVRHTALLVQLSEMVTSQTGSGSGGGGVGVPLNDRAFECAQFVRARLALMLQAFGLPRTPDWIADTVRAWETAKVERAGGRVDDAAWLRICAEFPRWVDRIRSEGERPKSMEVTVACPACGERRVVDKDGSVRAAVVVSYLPDEEPTAECRNPECATTWTGWEAVSALGSRIGAVQDRAVLAACGITLPGITDDLS